MAQTPTTNTGVSYKTKIQKFKQITTTMQGATMQNPVFPIKQRYKNLSKSQPPGVKFPVMLGVSYKTKIQKFKQITTERNARRSGIWVFPIKQRYKNLSKSQQERGKTNPT